MIILIIKHTKVEPDALSSDQRCVNELVVDTLSYVDKVGSEPSDLRSW